MTTFYLAICVPSETQTPEQLAERLEFEIEERTDMGEDMAQVVGIGCGFEELEADMLRRVADARSYLVPATK